ncbi:hypothetical protein D6777_04645 [Candidatus Woesearchaeota archaeon]|nr:MAG: hypothetical protein D6777_04645 [Candidatus Woesearchaeota archaeon]
MENKKGQGISLNFLIIAALALIALIIIALFFTGGISKIFKKQSDVVKLSDNEKALMVANCKAFCSLGNKDKFKSPGFSEEAINAGIKDCGDFDDFGPMDAESAWEKYCENNVLK